MNNTHTVKAIFKNGEVVKYKAAKLSLTGDWFIIGLNGFNTYIAANEVMSIGFEDTVPAEDNGSQSTENICFDDNTLKLVENVAEVLSRVAIPFKE